MNIEKPQKRALPRTPEHLGKHGRKVWRVLVEKYGFDKWELPILEAACRQADDIGLLEEQLRADGLLTTGSTGQTRLHPAVAEVRLARRSFARMLGELKLPEDSMVPADGAALGVVPEPGAGRTYRQRRASNAAAVRWENERRRRGDHLPNAEVFAD